MARAEAEDLVQKAQDDFQTLCFEFGLELDDVVCSRVLSYARMVNYHAPSPSLSFAQFDGPCNSLSFLAINVHLSRTR